MGQLDRVRFDQGVGRVRMGDQGRGHPINWSQPNYHERPSGRPRGRGGGAVTWNGGGGGIWGGDGQRRAWGFVERDD